VSDREQDDEKKRRAGDRFGKIHAGSVVPQVKAVSEFGHAAAKLPAENKP
jgi:hypothetical protein